MSYLSTELEKELRLELEEGSNKRCHRKNGVINSILFTIFFYCPIFPPSYETRVKEIISDTFFMEL